MKLFFKNLYDVVVNAFAAAVFFLFARTFGPIVRLFWIGQTRDLESVPDGPSIFISNHSSYLDFIVLGYVFYCLDKRSLRFWAKTKVTNHPIWRSFSKVFGAIEVKGDGGSRDLLTGSLQLLESGTSICIFPEGTRSRTGEIADFKPSYLTLARKTGLPVVSLRLENVFEAWPPHAIFPRKLKCHISYVNSYKVDEDISKELAMELNASIRHELINYNSHAITGKRGTWIRSRLDVSSADILIGVAGVFLPTKREEQLDKIRSRWGGENSMCFVCHSVRTGFDLLLSSSSFAAGDEVLISSLTIPDMRVLIEHNGLVVVPVPVNPETGFPDSEDFESRITPRTKALVLTHLYGTNHDITAFVTIAKKHNILLIEDSAQAYSPDSSYNSILADISMFSFGTIKTATALGGAALVFNNQPALYEEVKEAESGYKRQSRFSYLFKLMKYLVLGQMVLPRNFARLIRLFEKLGLDYDDMIYRLSRGFPGKDLIAKIRYQPSSPLLRLLQRRLTRYKPGRIEEQRRKGDYLRSLLPPESLFPEVNVEENNYWVFPLQKNNDPVVDTLRENGFDASSRHSVVALDSMKESSSMEFSSSQQLLARTFFVPLYPEMPDSEIERMAGIINELNR